MLLLLAPLLLLVAAPPAGAVGTLCLPSTSAACIAGTVRSDAGVVPDVKLTVTDPSGGTQEVVTGDDGKWNLQVTKEGAYKVTLQEDTLPSGVAVSGTNEVTVQAKFGATAPALIPVRTSSYVSSTSKFDELLQSSVSGLRLGLLLALASIGLSLIYGTTGLSNFAHAEQVTLGGILGYFLVNEHGLSLWFGGLLVVILCGFTGWFQDRIMWQPLRRRGLGLTQLMIVTIGLSLALQYTFQYTVGARTVRVVQDNPTVRTIGPITLTNQSFVAMGISIVVIAAVGFALLRTRDRPGHARGLGQSGARRGLGHRHRQGDPAGVDRGDGARRPLGPALRPGHQRHQVGLGPADPAAALRGRHARRPRHRLRGPRRLAHHRPRRRALPGAGDAR